MYTVNYTNLFDFGVAVGDTQFNWNDFGNSQLDWIDDGSSPPINLSTPIQFFGRSQHTLFVSHAAIHTHRDHS